MDRVEEIINVLSSQRFANFYNTGAFNRWITGDHDPKDKKKVEQQMRKELVRLFNRVIDAK